jgi:hypothetical protein
MAAASAIERSKARRSTVIKLTLRALVPEAERQPRFPSNNFIPKIHSICIPNHPRTQPRFSTLPTQINHPNTSATFSTLLESYTSPPRLQPPHLSPGRKHTPWWGSTSDLQSTFLVSLRSHFAQTISFPRH